MKNYLRNICQILVFAIIFNSTIPFLQSAVEIPTDLTDKLAICTPSGVGFVNLDGKDGQNKGQKKRHCPLCIPNPANDKSFTPSPVFSMAEFSSYEIRYYETANYNSTKTKANPPSPRDPPSVAL